MMKKQIQIPIQKEIIRELKAGDYVYLTGEIYTAEMPHTKE